MTLRFPSLHYLATQAGHAFRRFPLTIVASLLGVVLAIFLIETEDQVFNRFPYVNAMLCAALGISLYFCVDIFALRQQWRPGRRLLAQLIATLLLVGVYFSLPDAETTHNISLPYIRFGLYSIIVHLLVSFVPFLQSRQLNGFWNYNKGLFLRFLSALLYTGFLYVGLVMALLALKILFDVKIPDELFFELFVFLIGLFNTWFFVAGVPLDFELLEETTTYPKGLKIFTQYVLLSLLSLYLLILYGYGIKIILSWNWPEGIVSYMIMAVAVLGIFTMLLIHPYALQAEHQWIRKVSKGYYLLLLPLLALLFMAIGMRLADYGFTVNRYFIVAIGIWLSMVCVYFLSGRRNIKFVPISLASLLLLISFGPWGIFSVSKTSQVNRLEAVLSQGTLLRDGRIHEEVIWVKDSLPDFYSPEQNKHAGLLNDSLHNEVYSILDYLDDYHGFQDIQGWYLQPLDSLIRLADADTARSRWNRVSEARVYMESLGLTYQYKSKTNHRNYLSYQSKSENTLEVSGYDRLVYLNQLYYHWQSNQQRDQAAPTTYRRRVEAMGTAYHIAYAPGKSDYLSIRTDRDTVYFQIAAHIRKILRRYPQESHYNIPVSDMYLDTLSQSTAYRLIIEGLSFQQIGDTLQLQSMEGNLLIGKRK